MLFPSSKCAQRCLDFIRLKAEKATVTDEVNIVDLVWARNNLVSGAPKTVSPSISAVIFPKELYSVAKQYWQHSGDGISSRRAEFCHSLFQEGVLVEKGTLQQAVGNFEKPFKGPRRYQKGSLDKTPQNAQNSGQDVIDSPQSPSANGNAESRESFQFLEERFGRNLDVSFVDNARSAIRRRIAGSLVAEVDLTAASIANVDVHMRDPELSENDVYLYPCGMNAIFHTHQTLLKARGPLKSIVYGFPYVDTLKILEKWGPGCLFYGNGSSEDIDDLEARLKTGERFLALFCEFPGNPLLNCPDLKRIRQLADLYDFALVVDETIGNFINVNVLPYADVVASSLTKIFSGECNVMGGSAIYNPRGRYYQALKRIAENEYEDNYWAEDIIFLERNSRHFVSRIERINENAEAICNILLAHPLVKNVYYPKYNPSKVFYDDCRTPKGGYGGLLSFTFHGIGQAVAFYDRIETAKGPSLGTNFTLTSPYVILAHYLELDWAAQFGVPEDLIRISVGLEDADDLKARFATALKAAEDATT